MPSWKTFGLLHHFRLASSAWHPFVGLLPHRKTLKVSLPPQHLTWPRTNSLDSWDMMPTPLLPGLDSWKKSLGSCAVSQRWYIVPIMIFCLDLGRHWWPCCFCCKAHMLCCKQFLFLRLALYFSPPLLFPQGSRHATIYLPAALRNRSVGWMDRSS